MESERLADAPAHLGPAGGAGLSQQVLQPFRAVGAGERGSNLILFVHVQGNGTDASTKVKSYLWGNGRPRLLQHPREHLAGQQAHVVGEHAEHQPVDEVCDRLRVVAPLA